MNRLLYYIAKTVQATGLLLVLNAFIVSAIQEGSMDFLFKFSGVGLGIFMVGWTFQRYL